MYPTKFLSIVFVAVITFISCQKTLIKWIAKDDITKEVKVLENEDGTKSIVFFPMIHVGKPSYYESAERIIDSLREEGYTFYYESVAIRDSLPAQQKEDYEKKFRKIMGFGFAPSALPEAYNIKGFIYQDYKQMGIKPTDEILDLSMNQVIDSIEEKHGTIQLDKCDSAIPLTEKYTCKNILRKLQFDATNTFRNDFITKSVLNSNEPKIALIYGKQHWYFIYGRLAKKGYKITKGKI